MKGLATWKLLEESLSAGIPVMLLYVVDSKGSSPGRQGFFMAVAGTDSPGLFQMSGSIGGGIMEYKLVELAKDRLFSEERTTILKKQVHRKEEATDQSGMICSGEQTVLLYKVQKTDAGSIRSIISSLEKNKAGTLELLPNGIRFIEKIPAHPYHFSFKTEHDWFYHEVTGYQHRLYIIGGGHCAMALSALARKLDFYVIMYDDRPDLHTLQKNETAHEVHFINNYSSLKDLVQPGTNHYVVIMTMGYRTDDIAITALVEKEFAFIGVLGSRAKIEKMMTAYRQQGLEDSLLQKIQAPAGIAIHSQTPGEIAVSIAAALIQVKNHPR